MEFNREVVELKKRLIQYNDVLTITKNMNTELQKKNETLEIQNRQVDEDFCTLKDNHENLKKRFEILQKEISEIRNKSNKKSSMFDWIINGSVKEQNEIMTEKLIAVENELNIKISENEQIHMEIFEVKQNFNEKIKYLEGDIEKMKMSINDKMGELNSVNEKNFQLISNARILENNLNNISENLKKVENEFNTKTSKWKNKKLQLRNDIEFQKTLEENLIPINDYKNFQLNLHNTEIYTHYKLISNFENNLQKFLTTLLENIFNLITPTIETFFELLIERFNFICTNVELKTEHKGYLFACDKIRFHSFTFSQIIKTLGLFVKILSKGIKKYQQLSNEENFLNVQMSINIILTLLNKSSTYFSLITKYYKILLKEERKIVENFSKIEENDLPIQNEKMNPNSHPYVNKNKLNKDLKILITKMNSEFNLLVKKINLITNFDLTHNLKNIQVVSDNTSCLFIKVNENYFKNYKYNSIVNDSQKLKILEKIFSGENINEDTSKSNTFSTNFSEFLKIFFIKMDIDYKIFEKIKEDNKHKFNYPIINLSALKTNNENMKKNLLDINNQIEEKIYLPIKENLPSFLIHSWQFPDKKILFSFFKFYQKLFKLITNTKEIEKHYNLQEAGVDYETALKNRGVLKDLLEKENSQLRDRDNFMTKINEYEEDLTKYRLKLSHEQNEKDLLNMKLTEMDHLIKSGGVSTHTNTNFTAEKTADSHSETKMDINSPGSKSNHPNQEFEEFEEFLKTQSQCNISEIFQEILSDDVESGTQRSTFKLSKFDKCIPVTNFTAQIENNDDVSVLYHRKVVEKLNRYAGKIKNIDTKVLSNLYMEELKSEYEIKLEESVNRYELEMDYLNKLVKQKDDNIYGYTEQILMLNSFANDLENLKDNIRDCAKCKKFIAN